MTQDEYLEAIRRLGMTQVGAGRAVGLSRNQADRIALGNSPVPEPVARLLRIMLGELSPKALVRLGKDRRFKSKAEKGIAA